MSIETGIRSRQSIKVLGRATILFGTSASSPSSDIHHPPSDTSSQPTVSSANIVTIITTTPLIHIINPFARETRAVLRGSGYEQERNLGQKLGAATLRIEFTDVPAGSYEFILYWGNNEYVSNIVVGDTLHFDLII